MIQWRPSFEYLIIRGGQPLKPYQRLGIILLSVLFLVIPITVLPGMAMAIIRRQVDSWFDFLFGGAWAVLLIGMFYIGARMCINAVSSPAMRAVGRFNFKSKK